jgi:hypothetical protein
LAVERNSYLVVVAKRSQVVVFLHDFRRDGDIRALQLISASHLSSYFSRPTPERYIQVRDLPLPQSTARDCCAHLHLSPEAESDIVENVKRLPGPYDISKQGAPILQNDSRRTLGQPDVRNFTTIFKNDAGSCTKEFQMADQVIVLSMESEEGDIVPEVFITWRMRKSASSSCMIWSWNFI